MKDKDLLAKFLGWEKVNDVYYWNEKRDLIYKNECDFENDWNLLMKVVEKVFNTKIGDGVDQIDYPYVRTFGMINEETNEIMVRFNGHCVFSSPTLKQSTYDAVVDLIKNLMQRNNLNTSDLNNNEDL